MEYSFLIEIIFHNDLHWFYILLLNQIYLNWFLNYKQFEKEELYTRLIMAHQQKVHQRWLLRESVVTSGIFSVLLIAWTHNFGEKYGK